MHKTIASLAAVMIIVALAGFGCNTKTGQLDNNQPATGQEENTTAVKPENTQPAVSEEDAATTETKPVTVATEVKTAVGNVSVEATVPVKSTTACDDKCLAAKFVKCEPAVSETGVQGWAMYQYDILGPESGKCKIKTKYTENPNAAWVGKEMTCLYDNTKTLEVASKEVWDALWVEKKNLFSCTGPLADILLAPLE